MNFKLAFTCVLACLCFIQKTHANDAAIAAYEARDYATTDRIFRESLETNPKDAVALMYLGLLALEDDNLDSAAEYLEQALEIDPNNAKIQYEYALATGLQAQDASIFSAPGYARKSMAAIKKAVELAPEMVEYRFRLMDFYLSAPGILGGSDGKAFAEANAISAIDAPQGVIALASYYQQKGDEEKRASIYEDSVDQYPASAALTINRAIYYFVQESYEQAREDLKKVETIPLEEGDITSKPHALYLIGRTSLQSNTHLEEGIASLSTYLDSAPRNRNLPEKANVKFFLGELYLKTGDEQRATGLYQEVLEETQNSRLLELAEEALSNLR